MDSSSGMKSSEPSISDRRTLFKPSDETGTSLESSKATCLVIPVGISWVSPLTFISFLEISGRASIRETSGLFFK